MSKKSINLALQGGGSHGAYTWGVLDYLMEDNRINVQGISGTSAGAMNAVVFKQGYINGGREGAREALKDFWVKVSNLSLFSPLKRSPLGVLTGNWDLSGTPAYIMMDLMSRVASPYETNPFKFNPLRELIETSIDFEKIRSCKDIELFIAATNVQSGKIKVFEGGELTADMILASACLPTIYQAVEVDGIPYWDGGFSGNPPLFPLFQTTETQDIVIVQVNPIARNKVPKTAREIQNRINEISFNSSLLRELRSIEFVHRLLENNRLDTDHYANILVHRIEATEKMNPLSASSKMNSEWAFLTHLRDIGRESAKSFLDEHFDTLGKESSLDLEHEIHWS
ncbi:MAG TPA: patatin-like phospholipase family protein [Thiopseudomonas sp.]|nr:patatin-like phospholipase family protein [Thiopseudomonas sp.]